MYSQRRRSKVQKMEMRYKHSHFGYNQAFASFKHGLNGWLPVIAEYGCNSVIRYKGKFPR
jgi:hypothetical protein